MYVAIHVKSFNQSDCILEWNGYSTLIFLYEIASRCYIWSYVEINIFDLTYTNGLYLVNAICINHRDSSERHPKWNKRSHYDWNWCRDLRNDALISRCRFPDWRDSHLDFGIIGVHFGHMPIQHFTEKVFPSRSIKDIFKY